MFVLALASTTPSHDYYTLAEQAGQMHGLPPGLMSAVVRAESSGNPHAVSRVGAIGLAQLMPATAQQMGVNPWNAWENVYGGAKYLSQLIRRFKRLDFALAAYNAGPGRVRSYAGIPPFKETQIYVKRVLGYYNSSNYRVRKQKSSNQLSIKSPLVNKTAQLKKSPQTLNRRPIRPSKPQLQLITTSIDDLETPDQKDIQEKAP